MQAQTQQLVLHNNSRATVEGEIRPGSSDRYTVNPRTFSIRPNGQLEVSVTLKLLKYAARQRATEAGQRDTFHIKVGTAAAACICCISCSRTAWR